MTSVNAMAYFYQQDGFLATGSMDHKLVLVVRSDLKMGKGKAAAQVSSVMCVPYRGVE